MELAPLPMALEWEVEPADWSIGTDGALRIAAGSRTDLFTDPGGRPPLDNAPLLLGTVDGDFRLSARVRVDLRATYDAGALVLYGDADVWVKLALERSPQGDATIVSVVTRTLSDDCNAWTVDRDSVWLRVSRTAASYALHASADGRRWDLVRQFALDRPVRAGFSAQSPTGDGCTAVFDDIRYAPEGLTDLRDGS